MEKIVLHRLAKDVFNTPLMILPDKLDVILGVIGDRVGMEHLVETEAGADLMSRSSANRGAVESSSRISVIPIQGSLVNRTYGLSPDSMLQTYDDIRNEFNAALDSDSEAILFDINSPGGTASGVFDLVDEIYEARGEKPIYAMANDAAYSAAYAIASATDKIFLSRTGHVGSIGVIAKHQDKSAANEKAGIKYTTIFKGARKADLSPDAPLSDEARAMLEEEVEDVFNLFAKTTARNLNMPVAQVIATEAGIFMGDKAVLKGLAHEVIAAKDVQAKILAELDANPNKKEYPMDKKVETKLEEKEVKIMNAQELREKYPDMVAEIEGSVEQKLTAKFDKKATAMQDENGTLKASVLKLEKSEAIRQVREVKTDADSIWTAALNGSDVPERLHDKVKVQVSHDKFVQDGLLDRAGFAKAVKAEVEDWETRGATSQVMGAGFSSKDVEDESSVKLKKEEADDEALAAMLFEASGGKREEVK
ncbi:MAG: S49 family peptidase [Deltaproteobacteria bacterium]|nr:S49 family peptidase [Deltaproteobacteria bacterium]